MWRNLPSIVKTEKAVTKVKLNGKLVEESILSQQTNTNVFQASSESDWLPISPYVWNLKFNIEEISNINPAAGTNKRVLLTCRNVQADLQTKRVGKDAIVRARINDCITIPGETIVDKRNRKERSRSSLTRRECPRGRGWPEIVADRPRGHVAIGSSPRFQKVRA